MARNYISDLGAAESRLHWVMNGSFVLQGLLIFFGAVLVRGFFPARPVYRFALVLFAIAGMGVLVVGLVPEDTNARLHVQGAIAHFLAGKPGDDRAWPCRDAPLSAAATNDAPGKSARRVGLRWPQDS